jgi:cytoskeleton protein RodZ
MFEIGASLRTARERQGLELAAVERELHIRASYLAALEDERFDRTPGQAYAKGFLRSYADFLGLDGQRFVDEFNLRSVPDETVVPAPTPVPYSRGPRLLLVVAGIVVLSLLGVLVWRLSSGGSTHAASNDGTTTTTIRATPPPRHVAQPAKHQTATASHVIVRASGPCWVSIHAGSQTGPVLYEGTLEDGGVLRYTLAATRPQLWLRIGAPWNLRLMLNDKPTSVPRDGLAVA